MSLFLGFLMTDASQDTREPDPDRKALGMKCEKHDQYDTIRYKPGVKETELRMSRVVKQKRKK